jgi:signal transduction histidine kinase
VVIPDLLADPRTRDSELIQQNGLRSYIGSPIHTMTGKVIGSLCCMAKTPRDWSDKDIQMLESLSKCVDDIVIARTLALEDQAARKQLKDIAAARGAYIAHVGHEIRTPLTGILGSIGILKGVPLDEKPARLVKILDKSAHKLLEFVNDVLDLARLDAGPSDVAEEVARIGDFMKDQLKEFSIQAGEKGLTLRLEDRLQNACYRFDATALARIVQNIVSNAVKFTNVGSIDVTLDQDSYGQVVIDVSDTGIGIAPEYHSKIFEEFEQADEAAARRYGGTGLGMAIVKRTVDRLNGTITIDSARGVGTKILVSLPLSTAGADCDAA